MSDQGDTTETLIAKEGIKEALFSYCRGLDRRDWARFARAFWPDAIVEYGLYNGPAGPFTAIMERVMKENNIGCTQHFMGNIWIKVDADKAVSESYVQAYHRLTNEKGGQYDFVAAARYIDSHEKRGREWRITRRQTVFDWMRSYADTQPVAAFGMSPENGLVGAPGFEAWSHIDDKFRIQ